MSNIVTKALYDKLVIDGKNVLVFQCRALTAPSEPGDQELIAYGGEIPDSRFIHYEASDMTVQWFKSPFYVGKTEPMHEELVFQLRKWHSERQTKFTIAGVVIAVILYLLFK